MKNPSIARVLLAFVVAIVVATVLGAIVQTQYNLAALAAIDVEITAGTRFNTTVRDIFSSFSPTYAGYVVLPSLLVGFIVAGLVAGRSRGSKLFWFTVAGFAAIGLGIPFVNYLAPVALLVGATRDVGCILWMAAGGGVAGLLFAACIAPRPMHVGVAEPRMPPHHTAR